MRWITTIAFTITSCFGHAFEEDGSAFLALEFGPSTYKSKMVESTDTSFMSGYSLGISGGEAKNLDMLVHYSTVTTPFTYADSTAKSSIALSLQETKLRYALGPFYLGLVFGRTGLLTTLNDEKYLNSMGAGYGATGGLRFKTARGGMVFLDFTTASMSTTIDGLQNPDEVKVSIGARTDIIIGGRLRFGKTNFSGHLAYMQRSLAVTVGSTSSAEVQTATILGVGYYLK